MTAPTRRAALTAALASASALAIPAVAIATAAPPDADAELIAITAEIQRLDAMGEEICATRVDPFTDAFLKIMDEGPVHGRNGSRAHCLQHRHGRDGAIRERNGLDDEADRLWARLMAIPAATSAGRAAKVRALLTHVCREDWREDWRGPGSKLDWPHEQARALLGEFAGSPRRSWRPSDRRPGGRRGALRAALSFCPLVSAAP